MTEIDEQALLGEDLGSDRFAGDIIDEDELLGLNDNNTNQPPTNGNKPNVPDTSENNDETEQLDYDEEETDKQPRDKFSSEKKQENSEKLNTNQKSGGNKCFVNPKFQNRAQNLGNPSPQGPLPSLLSQTIPPPVPQMMGTPVDYNVRMLMMNSLRPIVPPNPMMRPMGPPVFPNPGMMPGMMPMQDRPLGAVPITAQIGQLSTVIQQQHDGTITFRTTIPQTQTPRVTVARAGCSEQGQNKDWNSLVDEFINGSSRSRKRERRSRSISSRSYSNSSYSGSYSGDSYSSRSASSRSPSPRHRRRRGSPGRKRTRSYRHGSYRRYRRDRSRRSPRRRRDSKSDMKNTLECAEAVGLDSEYVRKLEEQKKLREEVARQKYQRNEKSDGTKRESRRSETSSSSQRRSDEERSRSKTETKSSTQANNVGAVKPYLVVVINNLGNLTDAYKRVKMIALAVGPIKKVWQTSDESVSIIFEHHEHAKNFMLQYHMKTFNGITLNVNLEKIFLNLNSIP